MAEFSKGGDDKPNNYPNIHRFLGSDWLERIVFYYDESFSYIGDFDELDQDLEILSDVKGFESLIGRRDFEATIGKKWSMHSHWQRKLQKSRNRI